MAYTFTPPFVQAPFIAKVVASTANTSRDGTGTLATVKTGTTNGSRISKITIKAAVTTTAGMVRLYIDDGAGSIQLWRESIVTAITVSASAASFVDEILLSEGLILPSGYILKAAPHNAEAFNIIAEGAEY